MAVVKAITGLRTSSGLRFESRVKQKIGRGYGKYRLLREFGGRCQRTYVHGGSSVSFLRSATGSCDSRRDTLLAGRVADRRMVDRIIRQHQGGWRDQTAFLWALFVAEHWLERARSARHSVEVRHDAETPLEG